MEPNRKDPMKPTRKMILPALFALLGVVDFAYGLMKPDYISMGVGALMVGVSVYVIRREGS